MSVALHCLSSHSTTPTPTSSRGTSRECRRVVQLATGITSIAHVGRVGEDPREDVGVGVGVVECELYCEQVKVRDSVTVFGSASILISKVNMAGLCIECSD